MCKTVSEYGYSSTDEVSAEFFDTKVQTGPSARIGQPWCNTETTAKRIYFNDANVYRMQVQWENGMRTDSWVKSGVRSEFGIGSAVRSCCESGLVWENCSEQALRVGVCVDHLGLFWRPFDIIDYDSRDVNVENGKQY